MSYTHYQEGTTTNWSNNTNIGNPQIPKQRQLNVILNKSEELHFLNQSEELLNIYTSYTSIPYSMCTNTKLEHQNLRSCLFQRLVLFLSIRSNTHKTGQRIEASGIQKRLLNVNYEREWLKNLCRKDGDH